MNDLYPLGRRLGVLLASGFLFFVFGLLFFRLRLRSAGFCVKGVEEEAHEIPDAYEQQYATDEDKHASLRPRKVKWALTCGGVVTSLHGNKACHTRHATDTRERPSLGKCGDDLT